MKTLPFLSLLGLLATNLLAQTTVPAVKPHVTETRDLPGLQSIDYKSDPEVTNAVKLAGSKAITQWMSEFTSKKFDAKRYVILPIVGDIDNGYLTDQARNEFTAAAAGTDYALYTRDDTVMRTLFTEMQLGDTKSDMMDAATIQKVGRVTGAAGTIFGRVSGVFVGRGAAGPGGIRLADDAKVLQVRIILQAYETETGRMLWGGERFAAVQLTGNDLEVGLTRFQIIKYVAAGLGGLILLVIIIRALGAANRPR